MHSAGITRSSAKVAILTRSSSRNIVPFSGNNARSCFRHYSRVPLPAADYASVLCWAASVGTVDETAAARSRRQEAAPTRTQTQNASSSSTSIRQPANPAKKNSTKPKPYLIRVAGRTSSIQKAAGAVVKRLETEDMVRVAAIDLDSLPKAMLALTAANNMSQGNSGRMLVFQPTMIGKAAAEPPRVPEGSMVMYTTQIMAGEILALNLLYATSATDYRKLSRAIIARVGANSHTVLECYGSQALAIATQAVAQARKGLIVRGQDAACVLTSTKHTTSTPEADSTDAGPAAATEAGASRSSYKHRLVVLECERRRPRALLVRSTVGMSDRAAATQ